MAARPGEDLAATLFADVHYYYGPPTDNPPHHRFDKGSYVYLFENASQKRARLQIANHAGTPDQDAFDGFLDNLHIEYSYKHTCLVALTVDGNGNLPSQDAQEWRLPAYDPRNEKKYMYRLHSLDIYFWAKEDALIFLNATRRVLPQNQLSVFDEPIVLPTHSDMSPAVQKLENMAISDPSFQNGQTRESRPSASLKETPVPGPVESEEKVTDFAPLAYNPAAPPAPEAIRHREKTPPPPDCGDGNPLAAASASEMGQPFSPGYQTTFAGPPTSTFGPNPGVYFPGPSQAPVPASPFISPPPMYSQFGFSGPPNAESGFSSFQYTKTQSTPTMTDFSIHHQIYRPTEGEAAIKYKSAKEPRGKLEERAMKVEKGVTGFLKKIDKSYL